MGIRKPVHFNADVDADILKYAESFGNFSAYVRKLIRDDFNANKNKRKSTQKARPTPTPSEPKEVMPTRSHTPARSANPPVLKIPQQPNNPPPYRPTR
ncbi:MAG: hypothetical protein ACQEV7_07880 [Bacillota bacterium]